MSTGGGRGGGRSPDNNPQSKNQNQNQSQNNGGKKAAPEEEDDDARSGPLGPSGPGSSAPSSSWFSGRLGGVAVVGSLIFGKAKYVLVALKLTKFTPLISMVLTSLTYSLFFGWPFSVGMVGLIFVHECGHAIAMRHYGVPFSPMVFVPFMGAVIAMKERPKNVYEEAVIALGGPVTGSLGAGALAVAGLYSGNQLLLGLADFGLMINLFNLLPIGTLDGGRISSALSPWFNVAGLAAGGALIYTGAIGNPLFYLIMLSGGYTTASRFLGWGDPPHPSYYRIKYGERVQIGLAYFGLIAALIMAMRENNKKRKTPRQLAAQEQQQHEQQHELYGQYESLPGLPPQQAPPGGGSTGGGGGEPTNCTTISFTVSTASLPLSRTAGGHRRHHGIKILLTAVIFIQIPEAVSLIHQSVPPASCLSPPVQDLTVPRPGRRKRRVRKGPGHVLGEGRELGRCEDPLLVVAARGLQHIQLGCHRRVGEARLLIAQPCARQGLVADTTAAGQESLENTELLVERGLPSLVLALVRVLDKLGDGAKEGARRLEGLLRIGRQQVGLAARLVDELGDGTRIAHRTFPGLEIRDQARQAPGVLFQEPGRLVVLGAGLDLDVLQGILQGQRHHDIVRKGTVAEAAIAAGLAEQRALGSSSHDEINQAAGE